MALQAAQRRSLAFTMGMVQRQLDQRQQGPAAPSDVCLDLHATRWRRCSDRAERGGRQENVK